LTKEQLEYILKDRFDPTVFLSGNEIIGFANFYEEKGPFHPSTYACSCPYSSYYLNSSFTLFSIAFFAINW